MKNLNYFGEATSVANETRRAVNTQWWFNRFSRKALRFITLYWTQNNYNGEKLISHASHITRSITDWVWWNKKNIYGARVDECWWTFHESFLLSHLEACVAPWTNRQKKVEARNIYWNLWKSIFHDKLFLSMSFMTFNFTCLLFLFRSCEQCSTFPSFYAFSLLDNNFFLLPKKWNFFVCVCVSKIYIFLFSFYCCWWRGGIRRRRFQMCEKKGSIDKWKFPAERSKGWQVFNEIYLFSLFHILTPKSLFFHIPHSLTPNF
jgi:hypothetical protein